MHQPIRTNQSTDHPRPLCTPFRCSLIGLVRPPPHVSRTKELYRSKTLILARIKEGMLSRVCFIAHYSFFISAPDAVIGPRRTPQRSRYERYARRSSHRTARRLADGWQRPAAGSWRGSDSAVRSDGTGKPALSTGIVNRS